ncbi:MAG: Uma2 family endonuclease [Egibacteraceae bacterium]
MAVSTGAGMAQAQLARLEAEGKLDEALRYEILNGELVVRGFPLIAHEEAVNVLMVHLLSWTHEHGGKVFAGAGIEIGAQQLGPDVAFIGPERVGELDADGFHVPPDLVAEVTSPGTRSLDLHEKRDIYQELGVGEYWVVDLRRRRVLVHRLDAADEARTVTSGTLVTPVAPGLGVPVAELFAGR